MCRPFGDARLAEVLERLCEPPLEADFGDLFLTLNDDEKEGEKDMDWEEALDLNVLDLDLGVIEEEGRGLIIF